MRRRAGRVWSAAVYLLGALLTAVVSVIALPLLLHPAPRGPWVRWHRRRAARLLAVPAEPFPVPFRRFLGWLPAHVLIGGPAGLLTVLCLGNAPVAVVAGTMWWAFPSDDPPHLLIEVPVTGWGTAVALGLAQLAIVTALAYWVIPPLAAAHARLTLAMLAPQEADRLAARVAVLTRTRADVLDAHGAELRRIERDLHDGTQARLVAIAMRLAVARQALPDNPAFVADLLREAHEGTEEAMTELREVIRTMYPPILADQGLAGALENIAARSGVPVRLEVGDLGRVPAAVEVVAYFAVAEALTNVAKHSRATSASVRLRRDGDRLCVEVRDDGIGGAGEQGGTGLAGIRHRVEALDGAVDITSPAGGPTGITVRLPCGS
jgi:signal transduction histidine kinase